MDGQDVKYIEKKERKSLIYPRVDLRHAAYKTLVENGVDKTIAAEALGYKGKSCYEIEKRLEKKGKRIEVTSQKLVRKSVRNLEKLVDAQPFGTLENVKDSTVLAAIQVILDRSHPKKSEDRSSTPSLTFVNIDEAKLDYSGHKIVIENPPNAEIEQANDGASCGKNVGFDKPSITKENID